MPFAAHVIYLMLNIIVLKLPDGFKLLYSYAITFMLIYVKKICVSPHQPPNCLFNQTAITVYVNICVVQKWFMKVVLKTTLQTIAGILFVF
jgi:hypothetical protein